MAFGQLPVTPICAVQSSKQLLPVTVVVPIKNEAENLPKCLEALGQEFAEILIVDSSSADQSIEIALAHDAKMLNFEWNGKFPKKRNWALMNYPFKTAWAMFLDADEVVTPAFLDELRQRLRNSTCDGYWLNYRNFFLETELKHGVAQRKLALLRVGAGFYERIEEDHWSSLDMEVHEHPIVEGDVGEIRSPIRHDDFRGLARFVDRHVEYARWEANRLSRLGQAWEHDGLTERQKFKYKHLDSWWWPVFYFVYAYFFKLGLLDGAPGFYYALYKSWYFMTARLIHRELGAANRRSPAAEKRPDAGDLA